MRISLLFLATTVIVVAASGQPRVAADIFRSAENIAIVGHAEKVEVCMLYPARLKQGEDARMRDYDASEYREASPAIASFLRYKLVSDSSYRWSDGRKACTPVWNARLRFTKAGEVLTVDLCFGCDILQLSRAGQSLATWDFDPSSAEIFDAVRLMFPKDRVVRGIESLQVERARNREAIRKAIEAEKNSFRIEVRR